MLAVVRREGAMMARHPENGVLVEWIEQVYDRDAWT